MFTNRPTASPGMFLVVRHERSENAWWPQQEYRREEDAVRHADGLNDRSDPFYGVSYVAYDERGFAVSGKVLT